MNRRMKRDLVTSDPAGTGCAPCTQETLEAGAATPEVQLDSTITCPKCSAATRVRMPTDACQYFWECPDCGARLKPKRGDCCVFCSWGDVPCPPLQVSRVCRG